MFKKRVTLEEKFTTGLNFGQWQIDPKLKANFQYLTGLYPDRDEIFWFNYFLRQVREQNCPLAQKHLLSYLEEICTMCAKRVQDKLENTLFRDRVDHFFQEARLIIFYIVDFWRTYDPSLGKPLIYAYKKLGFSLQERFVNHPSDYGLLLSVSNKRLEENLKAYGFRDTQLAQHLIVAIEVRKIGAELPRSGKVIQEPTQAQLEKIGQYCQDLYGDAFSSHQVRNILQGCIKALKFSNQIVVISPPPPGMPDPIDRIPYPDPDEILESPEYSGVFLEVLAELITSLESSILLILSYGFLGINQELIGTVFPIPISQFTISRKLDKIRDDLQKQLKQDLLDRFPDDFELDLNISNKKFMKSLMIWYYRHKFIHEELGEWIRSYPNSLSITFLSAYFSTLSQEEAERLLDYGLTRSELTQQISNTKNKLTQNLREVALRLKISEEELLSIVNALTREGVIYLSNWLSDQYNLSADFLEKIKSYLEQTIYVFFANAPYASLVARNNLSQQIFSNLWVPEEDISIAFSEWKKIRGIKYRFHWSRKINLSLQINNYSFELRIGFEEEEKHKYSVQVRIYPSNGQKYLPKNLELLVLENRGNIFEKATSRECDNWIQVEFRGEFQEEFQVKIQLGQGSITEKFVI